MNTLKIFLLLAIFSGTIYGADFKTISSSKWLNDGTELITTVNASVSHYVTHVSRASKQHGLLCIILVPSTTKLTYVFPNFVTEDMQKLKRLFETQPILQQLTELRIQSGAPTTENVALEYAQNIAGFLKNGNTYFDAPARTEFRFPSIPHAPNQ